MISVILATKNGERFIDRTIRSVFDQTDHDIELIVVSDGSTDDTVKKVSAWINKDNRIRLIELKENIGPGLARDRGIKEARGTSIALIDDDDYWISKDKLAIQRKFLDDNEQCVAVGAAKTHLVNEDQVLMKCFFRPASDEAIRKSILMRNCFITSSVVFRKDAYIQAGGFTNMYLSEDYDLWMRMGLVGKLANTDGAETAYTIRGGGASKQKTLALYETNLEIIRKYKNNYPNAFLGTAVCHARIALYHLKNLFKNIP